MTGARAAILHVEDDPSLQKLVRAALEQLGGYIVRSAATGAEALALAGQFVPQLLLLDVDLPDMSGLAVLRALRGAPGYAAVPAVLLTAVRELGARGELQDLGVCEILQKPFRPRRLVQTIDRILAGGAP
jgi:two-component system, OmpR family, response regulator